MKLRLLIKALLPVIIISSCSISAFAKSVESLPDYVILKPVDLKGRTLKIPAGRRLYFKNGARLTNGVVTGNATSIGGSLNKIFYNVQITGLWNVPNITTSMFGDMNKDNSLVNVFALTNKNIRNVVTINPENYWITIPKAWSHRIQVVSNTEVVLNGTIILRANSFNGYKMIDIFGHNIHLHGKGSIIGDKKVHRGIDGEWGMGVNVSGGSNIKISGITIKDCWGDCIYIGGKATNVYVRNCILDGSRRQGVSITSAGKVFIENCTIKNIKGARPEYAIDVEPNANCAVDYVLIKRVKAINCNGGFMSWHPEKNSGIGTVEILNCSVSGMVEHYDYSFERTNKIIMKNNHGVGKKIRLSKLNDVILENNTIEGEWLSTYKINNCKKVKRK